MNPLTFSVAPAAEGVEWLRSSARIFRSQWLRYASIAALFWLIMQVSLVISGGILFVFLKPVLAVGFLAAAWHHERGELPEAKHLFAGFKSNLKALLPLGGVYLLGVLIAALIGLAVSGVTWDEIVAADGQPKLDEATQITFMLVTLAFSLPVNAALWFAPALIVFADATFTQALATSCRAFLRNWLAMMVYFLTIFLVLLVVAACVSPLLYISKSAALMAMTVIAMPLTAILMIGDYVCYRRVFHRDETIARTA